VAENEVTVGLLGIPQQQPNTGVEIRPKEIKKWIDSLPRANVGETAKLVYKNLYKLNRIEIPDTTRIKILALFWEPTNFLSEALKKHFFGLPFPLLAKKQQVALLAREIQAEMAVGYKIVAEGKMTGRTSRLDQKLLSTTVYYAMKYLGLVLLKSYQIYVPIPNDIWKHINRLYIHANQNKFSDVPIATDGNEYMVKPSIENLFKHILLLSLAGPYRLRQSDIETVNAFLEQWSSYAVLNRIGNSEQQVGMFSIDLSSDDAPGFFIPSDVPTALMRILETAELVSAIKDDITHYSSYVSSHGDNKNKVLSKKVLKLLFMTWNGIAKRSFSRSRKKSKVLVTFGLSNTHHLIYQTMKSAIEQDLEQKKKHSDIPRDAWPPRSALYSDDQKLLDDYSDLDLVEPVYIKKSNFSAGPVFGVAQPQPSKRDIWNPLYNSNTVDYDHTIFSYSTGAGEYNFVDESETVKHETHICSSINESPGGYRLVWQPTTTRNKLINALVGELVGIRDYSDDNESQWGVGVIRWMKHTKTKQLELGIQKLAPHAIAGGIQIVKKIKTHGPYIRTLILPEVEKINQPMTLIAPNTYSVGNILNLSVFGNKILINLTKHVEMTGAYSHFQFSTLSEEEMREHDDNKYRLDFDDVWSSIK